MIFNLVSLDLKSNFFRISTGRLLRHRAEYVNIQGDIDSRRRFFITKIPFEWNIYEYIIFYSNFFDAFFYHHAFFIEVCRKDWSLLSAIWNDDGPKIVDTVRLVQDLDHKCNCQNMLEPIDILTADFQPWRW